MTLRADAILFDKDGTLFDFRATWDVWAGGVLKRLAEGDAERLKWLSAAIGYDLAIGGFLPESPAIAGTNRQVAALLLPGLAGWTLDRLERFLSEAAETAPLVEAVPLSPLLARLRQAGLSLGVMTNDSQRTAHAHLVAANVGDAFDFVAGADSGFGAKPSPAPLLSFAYAVEKSPERVVMVGDSTHDLMAGRAAGMQTVAVLTGPATRAELAPLADVVLPNVGALPDWLGLICSKAS
ncbi:HAD family hydrolase [Primorskyibacter marinus]|uniref:HAD family hydrolase n=1 Tax=Primorskyibacter marinus TaxID=1977320 RepID=UPI000E305330|nr:HAD family hydrolase [Primorskyibacter marinus]